MNLTPPGRSASPPRRRRACIPCTNAKARCHFRDDDADEPVCERCERIGIRCTAKQTKSLRKPRLIKPLNNRVASLEERLDALTSAIETQNALASRRQHAARGPPSTSSSYSYSTHSPTTQAESPPEVVPPKTVPQRQPLSSFSESQPPLGLTWEQAENILFRFKEDMTLSFPFVWITEHTSARELLETKPCLFRAVMLAAAPLPIPRMTKMKRNVIAFLSQHLLVEEERSLDLLQGLLILIAWADLNSLVDQQVTNLTYLAIGYAHNLGITKIPRALLKQIGLDHVPDDVRNGKIQPNANMHSSEEMRTFLGCYYLMSLNSSHFGRQANLRSQYVDFCADTLGNAPEYPSDFILQQTVRMTQIDDRISEVFGAANDTARGQPFLFLVDENVTTLRADLDGLLEAVTHHELRKKLPHLDNEVIEDLERFFRQRYYYLLVRLYEPATYLADMPSDSTGPSPYRTTALHNCLMAAKSFFDAIFETNNYNTRFHILSSGGQCGFVMTICTRLLITDAPDWDATAARRVLDFTDALSRILGRLEDSERRRKADVEQFVRENGFTATAEELAAPGRFMSTAIKTRCIKGWYESRLEEVEKMTTASPSSEQGMEILPGRPIFFGRTPVDRQLLALSGNDSPRWFVGLLENSAWNFDDVEMQS